MAYSVKREGGVGIIVMENPPANAYTKATLLELQRCVDEVRNDPAIRCVVVKSAIEKFFSAGADISTLKGTTPQALADFLTMANETVEMIERTPKIFIAAIAGHCIGGGLELALGCDLRFAAEGKYGLGLGEVNLGLSPGMGGTQRLARLISPGQALHLMITGEMVGPQRAADLGIVERLFPADTFWADVMAYATKLAAGPSMAHGLIKLSVRQGLAGTLSEGLAYERANQSLLFQSTDAQEGIKAFLEKRKAAFQGK
ncbi:MAG: enoyl-CoA hydratase/isomerase family protein [Rhodospirillaceae bacterium]|nr:enoyl-CoA hydratase/isomerase family protein [Rhodospirillaceae bacterium]